MALAVAAAACGPSEAERVERAAKGRWHAQSASCTKGSSAILFHRRGVLYWCVLRGATIPIRSQFTDDFMSPAQHRCFFYGDARVADVSRTERGYDCALGR
jgi:hypothetical protein